MDHGMVVSSPFPALSPPARVSPSRAGANALRNNIADVKAVNA